MGFRLDIAAACLLLALSFSVAAGQSDEAFAKQQLGRALFYETALSLDGSLACASCHVQENAFAGPAETPAGIAGNLIKRQPMALFNLAAADSFGWSDATLTSLSLQMAKPLFGEAPVEMGAGRDRAGILDRLLQRQHYRQLFALAFGDIVPTWNHVTEAIVAFELTLVSNQTGFDAWWMNDIAPPAAAKRGFYLFSSERLGCARCHRGLQFRVEGYFANGVPSSDLGLMASTGNEVDRGKFKVPSLRNIAVTAPYMHAGQLQTLGDVMDHYARGPVNLPSFTLSKEERSDLLAFFHLLNDDALLTNPDFGKPQH